MYWVSTQQWPSTQITLFKRTRERAWLDAVTTQLTQWGRWTQAKIRPSPQVGVGSEFSEIPLNPQHNGRARSIEKGRRVKCVLSFVDRIFCECIFSSNFYKFIFTCSQNFFEQVYLTNFYKQAYLQKFQSTKGNTHFTRLRFSILQALTLSCGFEGIPENSEPTLTCGLGQSPHCEKKRVNSCVL